MNAVDEDREVPRSSVLQPFQGASGCKNPDRPVVYVGQTSKTPEERFAQHKKGGKLASPRAFKHGIRLLPDLYRDRNPLSDSTDPLKAELKLAKYLEAHGYTVRGARTASGFRGRASNSRVRGLKGSIRPVASRVSFHRLPAEDGAIAG
jgi:hypothetical protein